ncbi:hypothetical protein CPB86DRAFT_818378, partial [Serendipita vermifera]
DPTDDFGLYRLTHFTERDGGAFVVKFTGTSIGVYGSVERGGRTQSSYVLDGGEPKIYNVTGDFESRYGGEIVRGVAFYESPVLEYGEHILHVTADRVWTASQNKGYIFDFLTIGVKDDSQSNVVIVDDDDPAVVYNGFTLEESLSEYEYRSTLHKSNGPLSTATFNFSGTTIEAYGSMKSSADPSIPIISCYIDDGEGRTTYSLDTEGTVMTKLLLCGATDLSDGPHTLRLEALTTFEFWVDFFIYTASSSVSSPSVSTLPTPTSAPSQSSSSHKTRTASIAGGVIGGVAGLALIAFLIFLVKRRRQNEPKSLEDGSEGRSMGHIPSAKSPLSSLTIGLRNPNDQGSQQTGTQMSPSSSPVTQTLSPIHRLFRDSQRRGDLSDGTGSSLPPENSTTQSNISPGLAAPLPQKYSRPQVNPVEILDHDPSNTSSYTRDTRSPPPEYSHS